MGICDLILVQISQKQALCACEHLQLAARNGKNGP